MIAGQQDRLAFRVGLVRQAVSQEAVFPPDPEALVDLPPLVGKIMDSVNADVKNSAGRDGGSITAALFLQRFVNGLPWAHLDIAPVAWVNKSTRPTVPDGPVGWGVRLLDRMVADTYES